MKYQNPELLFFLIALAIPVLIHLFNLRKHKKIYFSSIRFLKEIKEKNRRKANLKNILVLISRILAIFFLIIAFAYPYIPSKKNTSNLVFIYIDNSFSMDIENENGRLLNIAKEKARIIINSYPAETNFYLITNDFLAKQNIALNKNNIEIEIDNIETSTNTKSINKILDNIETIASEKYDSYIISDLQESTFKLSKLKKIDNRGYIYLIPINNDNIDNISIDSCWLSNPLIANQKEIEIFATIKNHSKNDINEQIIFLNINNKQKSQQFINLKPYEKKEVKFVFQADDSDFFEGEIRINDSQIPFDNKLYFVIRKTEKISIVSINQNNKNIEISTLFNGDSLLFGFKNYNLNNINYKKLNKANLIILNEIQELTSGFLSSLKASLNNGNSILIIPPLKLEILKYNKFLKSLGLNELNETKTEKLLINKLNLKHSLFDGVFEEQTKNINYPSTTKYYTTSEVKYNIPLLKLENNKPFMSNYKINKGLVYIFLSPLDLNTCNFTRHALSVPIFINIATQSIRSIPLYNKINYNSFFRSFKDTDDKVISLTNKKIDFIPDSRTIDGKIYYQITKDLNKNGIYSLQTKNELIDKIAFNYNNEESTIKKIKIQQIEKLIQKFQNIEIIFESLSKFKNKLQDSKNNNDLWKVALILSLVFFGIEILLIKNIK